MLRFPNPGSDLTTYLRVYQELFDALTDRTSFDLDDMTRVLIARNLATSCGQMGAAALERSTREDRSRDPLYNQSKMYSEIYKILGWLHPTQDAALVFQFTYFGAHVVAARRDPRAIVNESLLGAVYPNSILDVAGDHHLRPFATILLTAEALDGFISRDEMIVGPLSLQNDRSSAAMRQMIDELRAIRGSWPELQTALQSVSKKRKISTNTMGNYTRFPIGALRWAGWVTREPRQNVYGRSIPFFVLTEEGRQTLALIHSLKDVRGEEVERLDEARKAAITRLGLHQTLARAGFDIRPVEGQLRADASAVAGIIPQATSLLFSPFQDLSPEYLMRLFPAVSGLTPASQQAPVRPQPGGLRGPARIESRVTLLSTRTMIAPPPESWIERAITRARARAATVEEMVEIITKELVEANRGDFYPLVTSLFCVLGYECEASRAGVNYQRWDAMIADPRDSIPIEIKSPGEEPFISIKAVRQAMENKIVLLSRKSYPTRPETTSLVVGYNLPNDRAEVSGLIADIRNAFGITIGIIDIRALLRLTIARLVEGKIHNPEDLRTLYGFINVSNT